MVGPFGRIGGDVQGVMVEQEMDADGLMFDSEALAFSSRHVIGEGPKRTAAALAGSSGDTTV